MTQITETHCIACANAPVSHIATYIDKTAAVYSSMLADMIRNALPGPYSLIRKAVFFSEPRLMRVLHILTGERVRETYSSSEECASRAETVWDEANRRSLRMEQLIFFGVPSDSFRVFYKDYWVYFESFPIVPSRNLKAFPGMDDKYLFKRLLLDNDIPCARGFNVCKEKQALAAFETLNHPVVVKPRLGTNSIHTTPFVRASDQLSDAFKIAQQVGRFVIIEEFITGNLCRATVVDGVLAGFMCSYQPTVIGDGGHTIRQLIAGKNSRKRPEIEEIRLSEDNIAYIDRQGYAADNVLQSGAEVRVTRLPGRSNGGTSEEMLDSVHPGFREYVEKAAQLLMAPVVGFDLIVPDARQSPLNQKWGFLEANAAPYIDIHNKAVSGAPSNVAKAIWDLWEKDQGVR